MERGEGTTIYNIKGVNKDKQGYTKLLSGFIILLIEVAIW